MKKAGRNPRFFIKDRQRAKNMSSKRSDKPNDNHMAQIDWKSICQVKGLIKSEVYDKLQGLIKSEEYVRKLDVQKE